MDVSSLLAWGFFYVTQVSVFLSVVEYPVVWVKWSFSVTQLTGVRGFSHLGAVRDEAVRNVCVQVLYGRVLRLLEARCC